MKQFILIPLLLLLVGCEIEWRDDFNIQPVGVVKKVEYLQGGLAYSKTILTSEDGRSFVVVGAMEAGVGDTIFLHSRTRYKDGEFDSFIYAYSVSRNIKALQNWQWREGQEVVP